MHPHHCCGALVNSLVASSSQSAASAAANPTLSSLAASGLRPLSVLATSTSTQVPSPASKMTAFATNAAIAQPPSSSKGGGAGGVLSRISWGRPSSNSPSSSRGFLTSLPRFPSRQRSVSISSPVPLPLAIPRESTFSSSNSASSSSLRLSEDDVHDIAAGGAPHASRRRYSTTAPAMSGECKLSSTRARAAIKLLPSYLIDARAITKYSPSTPDGALQLSVAENQLSEVPIPGVRGVMEPTAAGGIGTIIPNREVRLVNVLSCLASSNIARPDDKTGQAMNAFERDMIYYQPTQGVPSVRAAVADYLQGLLVSPTHPSLAAGFDPEKVVLGAGCNAVLENLCICLANPGDSVMIPTPYYAAFEFDLAARAGCHIVPVNTFDHHGGKREAPSDPKVPISADCYYPNASSLDAAYERAVDETGRPPRVLLLSHPNNPLGICYPPSVVKECIDWCREREVHLVSDEIYAGSVYRKEGEGGEPTFVSAMALGADDGVTLGGGLGLGPYVHLVYALSKDFALSGLRVGVAYTENEEILLPLQKLNDLCQISSQTQLLVERMLCANAVVKTSEGAEDDMSRKFSDVYLNANQDNIRARCDRLQSCLDDLGIPHLPADSGLFVWMDFREFLPSLPEGVTEATETIESKERRERELYLSLMKEHGLLFTPGMSMRNERAGFFRCVFTAASEEEFELGLVRLHKFVGEMRK